VKHAIEQIDFQKRVRGLPAANTRGEMGAESTYQQMLAMRTADLSIEEKWKRQHHYQDTAESGEAARIFDRCAIINFVSLHLCFRKNAEIP
jgi:hypothetical protein